MISCTKFLPKTSAKLVYDARTRHTPWSILYQIPHAALVRLIHFHFHTIITHANTCIAIIFIPLNNASIILCLVSVITYYS